MEFSLSISYPNIPELFLNVDLETLKILFSKDFLQLKWLPNCNYSKTTKSVFQKASKFRNSKGGSETLV
jgi:hypothetical protein